MPRMRDWIKKRASKATVISHVALSKKTMAAEEPRKPQNITLKWTASNKREETAISFLDLPRELRDCIYQYALILEQPFDVGHLLQTTGDDSPQPTLWPLNHSPRSGGLLSTCKQIHAEAAPVLYSENRFEVSLPSNSQLLQDLLVVDSKARKCSNDYGVPDRLTATAFHPTYRDLVTNLAFRTGPLQGSRHEALKFLLPMMWSLRYAKGAYFRFQAECRYSWWTGHETYVAGWRRQNRNGALSPHNEGICENSLSSDTVSTSNEAIQTIAAMSYAAGTIRAPFVIHDLRFNMHRHTCLRAGGHMTSHSGLSIEKLRRRIGVKRIIYIFTPISDSD